MGTAARIPRRGRTLAALGDHLLSVLALAGTACILLVLMGWAFNISIIMFRTGSMSPTITAGSIALVREVPATEMAEGDVVTVDRGEGILPVTHRVVEITDTDDASGSITFEMRGDANDVNDPEPYTATEVRRVMFSVPGAARVIQWFGNPYVLGALTLGATTLVIWAFWPRDPEEDQHGGDDSGRDHPEIEGSGDSDAVSGTDAPPRGGPALRVLALPLIVAVMLMAPGTGHAETTLIAGEHLRLQTVGDPAQMQNLAPGQPVIWDVGVWAEAPVPGEIRLGITGRGELASLEDGLLVSVQGCSERWTGDRCPSGAVELLAAEGLDRIAEAGDTLHLTTMPSDEVRWLRVEAVLAETQGSATSGAEGDVLIHAAGAGEEITSGDDPPGGDSPGNEPPGGETPGEEPSVSGDAPEGGGLARTGVSGALPLLATGLLAVALGIALRRPRSEGACR
ncbi:signal peptidase I [Brachybacterium avium]|uniref:Signal peptidase I n=1 Tax=Brachybacterium avium TaxID=2017485 RepID=A0A220UBN7_9MICO|nr:signal peptidase I [Brachybacterium avium]ASK65527.1 signal peptidase I [Brachybacterium avium]